MGEIMQWRVVVRDEMKEVLNRLSGPQGAHRELARSVVRMVVGHKELQEFFSRGENVSDIVTNARPAGLGWE